MKVNAIRMRKISVSKTQKGMESLLDRKLVSQVHISLVEKWKC